MDLNYRQTMLNWTECETDQTFASQSDAYLSTPNFMQKLTDTADELIMQTDRKAYLKQKVLEIN